MKASMGNIMNKKEKNLIHIIDLHNEKIVAYNNFQLCEFINDMIDNSNHLAKLKDLKNKRFLFVPNQDSAKYVVEKLMKV